MEADGFSAAVQAEVAKRRIYCLTPDPLSILMWSHYSANHSGICLEFHTSNSLFTKAQAVIYEPEYPTILPEQLFTRDTVDKVILTKANCWCYEEEFRLIASPFLSDDEPLKLRNGYLTIPDHCLMSVIVGCKGDHEAVTDVVRKHSPATRVIRIIRAPNEYKLMMAIDRTV